MKIANKKFKCDGKKLYKKNYKKFLQENNLDTQKNLSNREISKNYKNLPINLKNNICPRIFANEEFYRASPAIEEQLEKALFYHLAAHVPFEKVFQEKADKLMKQRDQLIGLALRQYIIKNNTLNKVSDYYEPLLETYATKRTYQPRRLFPEQRMNETMPAQQVSKSKASKKNNKKKTSSPRRFFEKNTV